MRIAHAGLWNSGLHSIWFYEYFAANYAGDDSSSLAIKPLTLFYVARCRWRLPGARNVLCHFQRNGWKMVALHRPDESTRVAVDRRGRGRENDVYRRFFYLFNLFVHSRQKRMHGWNDRHDQLKENNENVKYNYEISTDSWIANQRTNWPISHIVIKLVYWNTLLHKH